MVTISSLSGAAYVSTQKTATASVSSSTAASVCDSVAALTGSPPDTSTEPFSFSQVVADARAALDAGYKRLGKVGDDYTTGDQWDNTVGIKNMDRRTLYAIASNQGGQFSQPEIDAARFTMNKQESDAMMAADPFSQDPAAAFKAAATFLDQAASPEEKSSLYWAKERGSAECGYQQCMLEKGQIPEDISTGNPVVDLFATAGFQLSQTNDLSKSPQDMPAYKQATKLWEELYGQGQTRSLTV